MSLVSNLLELVANIGSDIKNIFTQLASTLRRENNLSDLTNVEEAKENLGLENVDNTTDLNKPVSTATQNALNTKVDKIPGKGLSTEDFTTADRTKLDGIAPEATKNATDASLRDRTTHTGVQPINTVTGLQTALDSKASNVDLTDLENSLSVVATTGNYSDLLGKPSIPTNSDELSQGTTNLFMTNSERLKLAGVEAGAEVNTVVSVAGKTGSVILNKGDVGLSNVDNTSDVNKPVSTAQAAAIATLQGQLEAIIPTDSDDLPQGATNLYMTGAERTKLAGVAVGATANATNAQLRDRSTHTGTQPASTITGLAPVATTGEYSDLTGLPTLGTAAAMNATAFATAAQGTLADSAIQSVDLIPYALITDIPTNTDELPAGTTNKYITQAEKDKLATIEGSKYRGLFPNITDLITSIPTASPGDYADVDEGVGESVVRYIWDDSDNEWVSQGGDSAPVTASLVKTLYESNPDTNSFTDAEKSKLGGIQAGATANATNAQLRDRATHTGTQPVSTITGLAAVATSGDYDDLSNKPTIPAAQVPSDWNATTGVARILNKPSIPTTSDDLTQGSTNLFLTTAERTKLTGIEAGAQVNTVTSVAGKVGAVSLVKADVGLGNVDNTSDLNKPISTVTQDALDDKVDIEAGKGLSTNDFTTVEKSKLLGIESGAQVNTVTSVAGKTGAVTLTKSDVGLSDVDNTSDMLKPISTATQTALNSKAPINSPTFTGTVGGITKGMVGLGNVDNTSDMSKPVSTAQAAAIAAAGGPSQASTQGYTTALAPSVLGADGQAWGNGSSVTAGGVDGIAIGRQANVNSPTSIVVGADTMTGGPDNIAIGHDSSIVSTEVISLGNRNSVTSGSNAVAIGHDLVIPTRTVAIGMDLVPGNSSQSVIIGNENEISGTNPAYNVIIGNESVHTGGYGVGIGSSTVTSSSSVSIGVGANLSGSLSVSIGSSASSTNTNGVAIGASSSVTSGSGVAIGHNAKNDFSGSVAIGVASVASKSGQIAIANLDPTTHLSAMPRLVSGVATPIVSQDAANKEYVDSVVPPRHRIADAGYNATYPPVASGNGALAWGSAANSLETNTIAIGDGSTADGQYSVAIGRLATISGSFPSAMAIGANTTATGQFSTAIGSGAKATATLGMSVALGGNTEATHQYSTALGHGAKTTRLRQLSIANLDPSTHLATNPCLISGVANPIYSQDAANKAYVDAAVPKITISASDPSGGANGDIWFKV